MIGLKHKVYSSTDNFWKHYQQIHHNPEQITTRLIEKFTSDGCLMVKIVTYVSNFILGHCQGRDHPLLEAF